MQKFFGFSLVEVILSVALFALFAMIFLGAVVYGEESAALSGARGRAALLAEEGLEAARNMRDENFANVAPGAHGIVIVNNQWAFSGASDTVGQFTRQVIVTATDQVRRRVEAKVSWQQNTQRTGSVSATTLLINWKTDLGGGAGGP